MEKITIKELVEFRRKSSDRSKKNFAQKLKFRKAKEKEDNDEGGGDYWVISTSCIYQVFKNNSRQFYDSKIDEVRDKHINAEDRRSQIMYQRNLEILNNFKDFDFDELRPSNILKFVTVQKVQKVINIDIFPLYLNPTLVFAYNDKGKTELGALWLVSQKDGFKRSELGLFCEILFRFLMKNFADEYQISEEHCIVIDTFTTQTITYSDMAKGQVPFLIERTLEEIKKL